MKEPFSPQDAEALNDAMPGHDVYFRQLVKSVSGEILPEVRNWGLEGKVPTPGEMVRMIEEGKTDVLLEKIDQLKSLITLADRLHKKTTSFTARVESSRKDADSGMGTPR